MARLTLQEASAVGQRVLLGGVGEFVDEAFGEEGVVGMTHAAPVADGHWRGDAELAHAQIETLEKTI